MGVVSNMKEYKKALKEYFDNEATIAELAKKYSLELGLLRGMIEQQLLVNKIKKLDNLKK